MAFHVIAIRMGDRYVISELSATEYFAFAKRRSLGKEPL